MRCAALSVRFAWWKRWVPLTGRLLFQYFPDLLNVVPTVERTPEVSFKVVGNKFINEFVDVLQV